MNGRRFKIGIPGAYVGKSGRVQLGTAMSGC